MVGIRSDILYPPEEQHIIARAAPGSELRIIDSDDGHDGFLLEQAQLAAFVDNFLAKP